MASHIRASLRLEPSEAIEHHHHPASATVGEPTSFVSIGGVLDLFSHDPMVLRRLAEACIKGAEALEAASIAAPATAEV